MIHGFCGEALTGIWGESRKVWLTQFREAGMVTNGLRRAR